MEKKPAANRLLTQFEINLYEASLKTNPDNLDALIALGYAYTKIGLCEKALTIDKKIVNLLPEDPLAHYNLACDYSLLKMINEAFNELELASLLGYTDFEHLEKDPDLDNLRESPRYQHLLNKIKSHLSTK